MKEEPKEGQIKLEWPIVHLHLISVEWLLYSCKAKRVISSWAKINIWVTLFKSDEITVHAIMENYIINFTHTLHFDHFNSYWRNPKTLKLWHSFERSGSLCWWDVAMLEWSNDDLYPWCFVRVQLLTVCTLHVEGRRCLHYN